MTFQELINMDSTVLVKSLRRHAVPFTLGYSLLPLFSRVLPPSRSRQARVEQEIRHMEGVMDIDFSPMSTMASQSPAVPETPGSVASSQGSGFGDAEWSLPVLTSVSSPTDGDCRQLLSRVQGFL